LFYHHRPQPVNFGGAAFTPSNTDSSIDLLPLLPKTTQSKTTFTTCTAH
jgi:hypothetical protein